MSALTFAVRPVASALSGLRRTLSNRSIWQPVGMASVLAAFCALSGLMLFELRQDTWRQATTNAHNIATVLSQDVARNFRSYDFVLKRTASLIDDPSLAGLAPALQQKILFQGSYIDRYFTSLFVLDRNGKVLWDRDSFPPRQANFADSAFFTAEKMQHHSGLSVSQPFRHHLTGNGDVMAVSRRIDGSDGAFGGVVVGTISLDVLRDIFTLAQPRGKDTLSAYSTNGILVTRSPELPGAIGKDYSATPNVRRFLEKGSGSFVARSIFDDVARLYSFERVPGLPLVLSVALAEKSIFAFWNWLALGVGIALAVLCAIAIAISVSMRRELRRRVEAEEASRQNEARLKLLADNSTDLILRLSEDRQREYVSPASLTLLGYRPESMMGRPSQDLIHPDDLPVVDEIVINARQRADGAGGIYRLLHADGRHIWVEGRYKYVEQDRVYVVVLRDISKSKAAEARLAAAHAELSMLARTDGLTGLANRRGFDEAIEAECTPGPVSRPVSLLLLDIDRFKLFNDRYGHPAGDECLREVAKALRAALEGETAFTARYGGEELAVILPGRPAAEAEAIAERVRAAIAARALPHEGNQANGGIVTVSVGQATLSIAPDAPAEGKLAAAELIAETDRLLYEAKRLGRNRVMSEAKLLTETFHLMLQGEKARNEAANELLRISGTLSPDALDNIAATAARLLGAPIGVVSLIGEKTAHLVGRHGVDIETLPREDIFCNKTIQGDTPFVVPDLLEDWRFLGNPLLEGDAPLRFYAGAPLLHPETKKAVGAVCVLDYAPRNDFDDQKRLMLKALSGIATTRFSI